MQKFRKYDIKGNPATELADHFCDTCNKKLRDRWKILVVKNDLLELCIDCFITRKSKAVETRAPEGAVQKISVIKVFSGGKPTAVNIKGIEKPIKSWKDGYLAILEWLVIMNSGILLSHSKHISKNKSEWRAPRELLKTGIFAETNLSSNAIQTLSRKFVTAAGLEATDFTFVIEENKKVSEST